MCYFCPCKITTLTNKACQRPTQVPRARANRMTNKDLNRVQNAVKKSESNTLTGAVKAWCNLFKSQKEINEILKENDIKVDKAIVPALVALAKDKEVVIQLCKEILPRVDTTFVSYKEVSREYLDTNESDKNYKLADSEIAKIAVYGKSHKRFGYNGNIAYEIEVDAPYFEPYINKDYKLVKVAVPIKRYTFNLIAKCVTYYLTHPKNER